MNKAMSVDFQSKCITKSNDGVWVEGLANKDASYSKRARITCGTYSNIFGIHFWMKLWSIFS